MVFPVYVIASLLIFAHITSAAKIYLLKGNGFGNELFKYKPQPQNSKLQTIDQSLSKIQLKPKRITPNLSLIKLLQDKLQALPDTSERDPTITKFAQRLSDYSSDIDKQQHNKNSWVINNHRRQPEDRYYSSSQSDEDSSKEFQDLTRGELSKSKISENDPKNTEKPNFSRDYIDFNDLRLGKKETDINVLPFLLVKFKNPYQRHVKDTIIGAKGIKHSLRGGLLSLGMESKEEKSEESEEDNENVKGQNVSEDEKAPVKNYREHKRAPVLNDSKDVDSREDNADSEEKRGSDSEQNVHEKDKETDDESNEEIKAVGKKLRHVSKDVSHTSKDVRHVSKDVRHVLKDVRYESGLKKKRFTIVKGQNNKSKAKKKKQTGKKQKPKLESRETIETEEDNFPSSEEAPKKKEMYIQRPKKSVKFRPKYEDLRKRLQHFLPKRYHWEEDEVQDLGYFWFNGPQGSSPPGMWRIGY